MAESIDYSKFSEYNPKKRMSAIPILIIILIAGLVIFLIKNYSTKSKIPSRHFVPLTNEIIEKGIEIFRPDKNSVAIEKLVQNELENTKGDYAIAIKHLKTGERYYFNEHKIFETASLYKIFVMATVFQKIQDGDLNQNDILSQKIAILNQKFKISSESAELTEGDITLPVNSALSRMITISDNYSALLLTEKVRLSQVSLFLNNNSLTDSLVGTKGESPTTSAFDLIQFFEKLYHEELASKSLTTGMLVLLKNQTINNKLPKYLPPEIEISHKTGELGKISHDAGIIFTPKGNYAVAILTETPSPMDANEKIAIISKIVYQYFSK